MKEFGVQPEAWGPFAEEKFGIFQNETLNEIAKKYGKTATQVILRWNVQRNIIVIPKTIKKERMEQNFDIWDFELSNEDMQKISTLDLEKSNIIDHFTAETAKFLNGYKIHN